MAEQRTFNPLVQGSTPWRPTQPDLRASREQGIYVGSRPRLGDQWETIRFAGPPATTFRGTIDTTAEDTSFCNSGSTDA
jgi:hypothetical protein